MEHPAQPDLARSRGVRRARAILALSALPFAAIGAAFLLAPGTMATFVDVRLASATADADVRAVYGGLQLGCALFLLWAAADPARCRAGLVAQLALYGGLALARLPSYALAGLPSPLGLALHAGELVGLALGVFAWRQLGQGAHELAA